MRLYENHVGAASANHMLGLCLIHVGELERASACLSQSRDSIGKASSTRPG